MDRSIARAGAWAGVVALIGIFGSHLALMAIAGQRVSGTTDPAQITAYYGHPAIALLSVGEFLVLIPFAVFMVALRESVSTTPWTRFLATIGLVAATVEFSVILTEIAAQAALVATAQSGGDVVGLFRFWDALYNSGAYALEATWVAAFGLAMRHLSAFSGWLPRFSFVTAALLAINVSAIWVGIPRRRDAAVGALPGDLVRRGQFRTLSNGDRASAGRQPGSSIVGPR
ncbi:MAG: hypothetical protein H0V73_01840 [Chloroflexi bacterium]|nr:hypothetical protein [Chloroflexota bacterium]